MRFGVISDTHDNVAAIEAATDFFEREGVDLLLHCGDFIAPPVLPFFEGFELHGVLGNNDGEVEGLEAGFDDLEDAVLHGRVATLDVDGTAVCMLHGDQGVDEVEARAEGDRFDYVFYGHFHVAEERAVDGTTVVNPGAHFPTVPSEHRSVVVVDTETDDVTFHRVED